MTLMLFLLAVPTLAAALAAMCLRNLVHAALCAAICFTGVAALFVYLGAEFMGFAQVIIYVGAIAILLLFAVLLTRGFETLSPLRARQVPWPVGVMAALITLAVMTISVVSSPSLLRPRTAMVLRTRQVGDRLMTDYVLPMEAIGLLMTAVLIGAAVLALRDSNGAKRRRVP